MRFNVIEVMVGALVLIVASVFLIFAYQSSHWQSQKGYDLYANFDRVDGLAIGTDVRVSGVKVGSVVSVHLEPTTFFARVKFILASNVKIPQDSLAEIVGDGLFGTKYLAIVPGGSEEMLAPGGQVKRTQAAVSLETLISKFLFNKNE